jgi:hypothetical protein
MASKTMIKTITTKCPLCGIVLDGGEQFVGHMIHNHEIPLEQAVQIWKKIKIYSSSSDKETVQCAES